MVYKCPKCGNENPDDSKFCGNCGATLHPNTVWYSRGYRERRSRRVSFWLLLLGLIIILWGASDLVRMYYGVNIPWWPIILIIIGIYIIARSLEHRR